MVSEALDTSVIGNCMRIVGERGWSEAMLLFTGHVSKSRLKSTHTTVSSTSDYRTVTLLGHDWIVRDVFAVNLDGTEARTF